MLPFLLQSSSITSSTYHESSSYMHRVLFLHHFLFFLTQVHEDLCRCRYHPERGLSAQVHIAAVVSSDTNDWVLRCSCSSETMTRSGPSSRTICVSYSCAASQRLQDFNFRLVDILLLDSLETPHLKLSDTWLQFSFFFTSVQSTQPGSLLQSTAFRPFIPHFMQSSDLSSWLFHSLAICSGCQHLKHLRRPFVSSLIMQFPGQCGSCSFHQILSEQLLLEALLRRRFGFSHIPFLGTLRLLHTSLFIESSQPHL